MARNYLQGRYVPHNPHKYKGNVKNIVFRSSWERAFMRYCDLSAKVKYWSSEEVSEGMVIPYISPKDEQIHRYYMDFKIVTGVGKVVLIEIKPFAQTRMPKVPKRQTKRYLNECLTYAINEAKWMAASNYCKKVGWDFKIITEKQLFKSK